MEVAISGVGAISALGNDAPEFFARLAAGESGVRGGIARCDSFKPREYVSAKDERRMDRFALLALAAAEEACGQAGWDGAAPYEPHRVGCVIGTGVGGITSFEEGTAEFRELDGTSVSSLMIPKVMPNAAAAHIAMRWKATGPSWAITSACASGADAVAAGVRLIRSGAVDAVVAGGTESALSSLIRTAFRTVGALSPTGVCRPFDVRRNGLVLGEGAAALVLEAVPELRRRGARELGRVLGVASSCDAFHLTKPDATASTPARTITEALSESGLEPETISYVNAHGTGTKLNDRVESEAIKLALGRHAPRVPVSSIKAAIGHTFGAAGALEAVCTVMALQARTIPPTVGLEQSDPELGLDFVAGTPTSVHYPTTEPVYGISNSFGFGGHNVVLAIGATD